MPTHGTRRVQASAGRGVQDATPTHGQGYCWDGCHVAAPETPRGTIDGRLAQPCASHTARATGRGSRTSTGMLLRRSAATLDVSEPPETPVNTLPWPPWWHHPPAA